MRAYYKNHIRLIASLAIAALAVQDIAWAAPGSGLSAQNPVANSAAPGRLPIAGFIANPSQLSIPLEAVTLQEVHAGTNGKLIIHIQDAHANLSGQQNLAKALEQLLAQYDLKTVLVEGSSRDSSLDSVRKLAPLKEWKIIARRFLYDGIISGEEYVNLTTDRDMKILGVEYQDLYDAAVKAYAAIVDHRQDILHYLYQAKVSLERLKHRLYPDSIGRYEAKKGSGDPGSDTVDFKTGFSDLLDLAGMADYPLESLPNVARLKALLDQEQSIDFARANAEQARLLESISARGSQAEAQEFIRQSKRLRASQVSQYLLIKKLLKTAADRDVAMEGLTELKAYEAYLSEFMDLKLDDLLTELEFLEDKVYEKLLPTDDAKKIRAIDRFLGLLGNAYKLQMSSHDFGMFTFNEKDFATESWLAFMNRKLAELKFFESMVPYADHLEKARKDFGQFYDLVGRRDQAFVENAHRLMAEQGTSAAVLIAGGYHTAHLTELLRAEGTSYVVLTPVVTDATDHGRYEELLLQHLKNQERQLSSRKDTGAYRAQNVAATKIPRGVRPASGASRLAALEGYDAFLAKHGVSGDALRAEAARMAVDISGYDEVEVYGKKYQIPAGLMDRIRPATAKDLERLVELEQLIYPLDPERYREKLTRALQDADNQKIFVYVESGEVLGFIQGGRASSGYGAGISGLAVDKSQRRRKIATALRARLMQEFDRMGITRISSNPTSPYSRQLAEKFGMTLSGAGGNHSDVYQGDYTPTGARMASRPDKPVFWILPEDAKPRIAPQQIIERWFSKWSRPINRRVFGQITAKAHAVWASLASPGTWIQKWTAPALPSGSEVDYQKDWNPYARRVMEWMAGTDTVREFLNPSMNEALLISKGDEFADLKAFVIQTKYRKEKRVRRTLQRAIDHKIPFLKQVGDTLSRPVDAGSEEQAQVREALVGRMLERARRKIVLDVRKSIEYGGFLGPFKRSSKTVDWVNSRSTLDALVDEYRRLLAGLPKQPGEKIIWSDVDETPFIATEREFYEHRIRAVDGLIRAHRAVVRLADEDMATQAAVLGRSMTDAAHLLERQSQVLPIQLDVLHDKFDEALWMQGSMAEETFEPRLEIRREEDKQTKKDDKKKQADSPEGDDAVDRAVSDWNWEGNPNGGARMTRREASKVLGLLSVGALSAQDLKAQDVREQDPAVKKLKAEAVAAVRQWRESVLPTAEKGNYTYEAELPGVYSYIVLVHEKNAGGKTVATYHYRDDGTSRIVIEQRVRSLFANAHGIQNPEDVRCEVVLAKDSTAAARHNTDALFGRVRYKDFFYDYQFPAAAENSDQPVLFRPFDLTEDVAFIHKLGQTELTKFKTDEQGIVRIVLKGFEYQIDTQSGQLKIGAGDWQPLHHPNLEGIRKRIQTELNKVRASGNWQRGSPLERSLEDQRIDLMVGYIGQKSFPPKGARMAVAAGGYWDALTELNQGEFHNSGMVEDTTGIDLALPLRYPELVDEMRRIRAEWDAQPIDRPREAVIIGPGSQPAMFMGGTDISFQLIETAAGLGLTDSDVRYTMIDELSGVLGIFDPEEHEHLAYQYRRVEARRFSEPTHPAYEAYHFMGDTLKAYRQAVINQTVTGELYHIPYERVSRYPIHRFQANLENLSYPADSADLIVATHSIQWAFHFQKDLAKRYDLMRDVLRSLRPGGELIIDSATYGYVEKPKEGQNFKWEMTERGMDVEIRQNGGLIVLRRPDPGARMSVAAGVVGAPKVWSLRSGTGRLHRVRSNELTDSMSGILAQAGRYQPGKYFAVDEADDRYYFGLAPDERQAARLAQRPEASAPEDLTGDFADMCRALFEAGKARKIFVADLSKFAFDPAKRMLHLNLLRAMKTEFVLTGDEETAAWAGADLDYISRRDLKDHLANLDAKGAPAQFVLMMTPDETVRTDRALEGSYLLGRVVRAPVQDLIDDTTLNYYEAVPFGALSAEANAEAGNDKAAAMDEARIRIQKAMKDSAGERFKQLGIFFRSFSELGLSEEEGRNALDRSAFKPRPMTQILAAMAQIASEIATFA